MGKKYFLKLKKNYFFSDKPAFSMIEIITILLVVSIGMTGLMSLIVQNIQSQSINKKTLIAYQLAQEGVELIRQVRDSNWRSRVGIDSWKTNLAAGEYYMDYTNNLPVPAEGVSSGKLSQDADGMYYSNPGGSLTENDFARIITIDYPDSLTGKMKLNSTVYWADGGKKSFYTIEAELYDWRQ